MSSKELVLWIDERWYQALNDQLGNQTLEEYLHGVIDQMCTQLPDYKTIQETIRQETEQARLEQEAAMRFAVFRVTENDNASFFRVKEKVDMIQAASRLRLYVRMRPESPETQYREFFNRVEPLTRAQFDSFVSERRENTGRVTGAFHINFDQGTFDSLHVTEDWQRFHIRDVTTAAYFAMKRAYTCWDQRWEIFEDRLDGKQIAIGPDPGEMDEASSLGPQM